MKTKNETGKNLVIIGAVGYPAYYRIPYKSRAQNDLKGVEG